MTKAEPDGPEADAGICVEIAVDDAELADHVREMLVDDPGLRIVDGGFPADIRITDGAVDLKSGAPVLVMSAGPAGIEALRAGAAAVLAENANADALRSAIRAAAHGLTVFTGDVRDQLIAHSGGEGLDPAEDELSPVELTEREMQVVALLAEGASNKSIARSLGITPHTAKFHVASIVVKLDATGRTEAVAKAMRMGLLMI